MHTALQKNIQDILRNKGYLVIIEPAFDNRNADILVQNPQTLQTTIIEIELHKNYRHAFCSLNSDLKFSDRVIVVCGDEVILNILSELSMKFHHKDRQRILFVLKNQYIKFIRTLFQNKNNNNIHNRTQNKVRTKLRSELTKEVIGVNIKKKGNKLHFKRLLKPWLGIWLKKEDV